MARKGCLRLCGRRADTRRGQTLKAVGAGCKGDRGPTPGASLRGLEGVAMSINDQIRIFRWKQQGMAGGLRGSSAAEVLAATGWVRSVGGSTPYLTLHDRAGISREAV